MILVNLFSVFDPSSYFGMSLNWVIIFIIFLIFPTKFFLMGGVNKISFLSFMSGMNSELKEIAGKNYYVMIFVGSITFFYLAIGNVIGLIPFVFTFSAHPVMTMAFGVIFWLSFSLMGWLKNFKNSAAHLVPEGSPLGLAPLMVLIESISHIMRPFTLSIRLAANMMAGHLIISLLSSISLLNSMGFLISFLLQSMLLILEIAVALIQGFVFSVLLLLYALEYY